MKKLVIDISHHNGKVDWKKVKDSGVWGAMLRIGYSDYAGEINFDKRIKENLTGAYENGLHIGIYVYAYNRTIDSVKRTTDEIVAFLMPYKKMIDMPVAFDIEETGHDIFTSKTKAENAETCIAFCEKIKEHGFYPMIYSYTLFIHYHLDMDMLKDYDLWIADYRDSTGTNCPYKGNHTMWQYIGEAGRTDGVNGPCDRNWCYKDYPSILNGDVEKEPKPKEKTVKQLKEKIQKVLNEF